MKPGTEITTQRAREFNLPPQQENEDEMSFRRRVSGALRDQGNIIEAHEAFNNELYDQSTDAMTGIIGALAQVSQDVDFGSKGDRQVDDDFAAGVVVQAPKEDPSMALLAMMLFGGKR